MRRGGLGDERGHKVRDRMKIELASSVFSRLRGLFGRGEFEGVLLLTPCNDVHTFGMKRAIDVAFITRNGVVVEAYRNVGRRRRLRCARATATLERFSVNAAWFERGDRVELKNLLLERGTQDEDVSSLPSRRVR